LDGDDGRVVGPGLVGELWRYRLVIVAPTPSAMDARAAGCLSPYVRRDASLIPERTPLRMSLRPRHATP
jgi:hypothetical protein